MSPFSTRWVDAGDLQAGDVLLLKDRGLVAVETVALRNAACKVYNFCVDELHNYAVGQAQVLVHNNSGAIALDADDVAFGLTRAQREKLVASRPERYRKGVVDKVWKNAMDENGKVYDPNTLEELTWDRSKSRDGQWDMGHIKDKSYKQLKQRFLNGEISRKQYLNEYNNTANYRPEARPANRGRRYN